MKKAIATPHGQPTSYVDLTQDEANARNAEIASNEAKELANAWKVGRANEYPTMEECIHAILDGDLEALQAKRQAVKLKYPKGE
tara:strand:+ start:363 stop:614 length:252 start_codon:yes stop_codon:yes gene_type:complete